MKKLLVIFIVLVLAACATQPATPQAKATQVPPALTSTSVPTRTPIPTNTPVPTVTSLPTAISSPTSTLIPTPSVPLRKVLITISDFANMSEFYSGNPILNDKSNISPKILDLSEETFIAKDPDSGKVTMTLVRYESPLRCKIYKRWFEISSYFDRCHILQNNCT